MIRTLASFIDSNFYKTVLLKFERASLGSTIYDHKYNWIL